MNTDRLDAAISAACRVCRSPEVIVVGPAALYASINDGQLRRAHLPNRVDIFMPVMAEYSYKDLDLQTELGLKSSFQTHEHVAVRLVYADQLHLPSGWHERLVSRQVGDVVGQCAELHDVCASLLATKQAGSHELVELLMRAGMVDPLILQRRVQLVSLHDMEETVEDGRILSETLSLLQATRAAERLQSYVATLLPVGRRR